MKKIRLFSFITLMAVGLSCVQGQAVEGVSGKGGGDISGVRGLTQSDEIILSLQKRTITDQAVIYLESLSRSFDIFSDEHAKLKDLISKGLVEDVRNSPYSFQTSCAVNGKVTSMSTTKGQRNAPICINLPRIVTQLGEPNHSWENLLVGLLIHESARHFNEEDTLPVTDFHPLASFAAKSYPLIMEDVEIYQQSQKLAEGVYFRLVGSRPFPSVSIERAQPVEVRLVPVGSRDPECEKIVLVMAFRAPNASYPTYPEWLVSKPLIVAVANPHPDDHYPPHVSHQYLMPLLPSSYFSQSLPLLDGGACTFKVALHLTQSGQDIEVPGWTWTFLSKSRGGENGYLLEINVMSFKK